MRSKTQFRDKHSFFCFKKPNICLYQIHILASYFCEVLHSWFCSPQDQGDKRWQRKFIIVTKRKLCPRPGTDINGDKNSFFFIWKGIDPTESLSFSNFHILHFCRQLERFLKSDCIFTSARWIPQIHLWCNTCLLWTE